MVDMITHVPPIKHTLEYEIEINNIKYKLTSLIHHSEIKIGTGHYTSYHLHEN